MSKIKILIFQTIFGFLILFIWFRFIDFGNFLSYFSQVDLKIVFLAVVFYIIAVSLRIIRWRIFVSNFAPLSFNLAFGIGFLATFLGFLVPIRLGEFAATFLLKKETDISYSLAFSTVAISKVFDFLAFLISVIILSFFVFLPIEISQILTFALIVFFIIFLALYLFIWQDKKILKLINQVLASLPENNLKGQLQSAIKKFVKGFTLIRQKPQLLATLLLFSFSALITDGFYFYLIFLSFGYSIEFVKVFFGFVLFSFTYLIPSPPGYVGTTEVAGSVVFTALLGLEVNKLASLIVFTHLLNSIVVFTLGIISLYFLKFQMRQLLKLVFARVTFK